MWTHPHVFVEVESLGDLFRLNNKRDNEKNSYIFLLLTHIPYA